MNWEMPHTSCQFEGNYNGTDPYKVSVDSDPVLLRRNTRYWIGLSGSGRELGQAFIETPGDGRYAFFHGPQFDRTCPGGALMFRLRGHAVLPSFELALEGACPGPLTASIIGATPGGRIALLRG